MIQVFGVVAAITGVSSLTAMIYAFVKLVSRDDQLIAARDTIAKSREETQQAHADLLAEMAAHAVTRDQLAKERDLRARVESERNSAYLRAKEFYAEYLKTAPIAEAAKAVTFLLASPLPGLQALPTTTGDPAGDSDLQKPGM